MRTLLRLFVLVAATNAAAEPTSLMLPAGLMLTFEAPTVTEEQVEGLVREGVQPSVERSKERQVNYVSISHGDLLGGYASLTSPDGTRPFNVIGRETHASVTTVITYVKQMIFSVSIASTRAPDKDFQDALDAVRNMQ